MYVTHRIIVWGVVEVPLKQPIEWIISMFFVVGSVAFRHRKNAQDLAVDTRKKQLEENITAAVHWYFLLLLLLLLLYGRSNP